MIDESGFWRHTPLDGTEWEMISKQDTNGIEIYMKHDTKKCGKWLSGTLITLVKRANETPVCLDCKTPVPEIGVTHAMLSAASVSL